MKNKTQDSINKDMRFSSKKGTQHVSNKLAEYSVSQPGKVSHTGKTKVSKDQQLGITLELSSSNKQAAKSGPKTRTASTKNGEIRIKKGSAQNEYITSSKIVLDKKDSRGLFKFLLPFVILVMILILIGTIKLALQPSKPQDTSSQGIQSPTPQSTTEPFENAKTLVHGMVKRCNFNENQIAILDVDTSLEQVYKYSGGTRVLNRYLKEISMEDMNIGELVTIVYNKKNNMIYQCMIPEDAWENKNISKFALLKDKNQFRVGQTTYNYKDTMIAVFQQDIINLIKLSDKDILTVRGIGEFIYSITVEKGHGYIKLSGYEAFQGGTIEIGYDVVQEISNDMMITVQEGDYKVTLQKNGLTAIKFVHVAADEETTIDMSEYKAEVKKVGEVEFSITPEGAQLVLEGAATAYDTPVKLEYGEYKMEVRLEGYVSFLGNLSIGEDFQNIKVALVSEESGKPTTPTKTPDVIIDDTEFDDEETKEPTATATASPEKTEEPVVDNNSTISITAPVDADLFFDDVYKGKVPVTFTKETGTHVITLKQDGYETKKYTIEVANDGKMAMFRFPEMAIAP